MSWPIVNDGDDISPPNTSAAVVASGDQPTDGKIANFDEHRHATY
jgi:hypothetical protein